MRAYELIANFLQLIDKLQEPQDQSVKVIVAEPEQTGTASPLSHVPDNPQTDDIRRFRQIVDLVDNGQPTEYSNTPKEEYAGIEAVTTDAGGGWQEPKHPSDIRVQHPSAYPGHQHNVGE